MKVRGLFKHQRDWIKRRDKYKCQLCHSKKELSIHHIVGRHYAYHTLGWELEKINSPFNNILLCKDCHTKIHGNPRIRGDWNPKNDDLLKLTAKLNTYLYLLLYPNDQFSPLILYP